MRDSAYDGLPYRLRRELHGRAGDLVRATTADPDDAAELLSLHYFHAQRRQEAYTYSRCRVVGVWVYANVEATEFYQRAFVVARDLDVPRAELGEVAEALGDMHDRTGSYAKAQAAYNAARPAARRRSGGRRPPRAQAVAAARAHGSVHAALRWITRWTAPARRGARRARRGATRRTARVWYGHFSQDAGRHATAIKWCRLAMEEAEVAGDKDAMVHALRIMDWAYMDLGRLESPDNLVRALALYEEIGDLTGAGGVLNMLGGIADLARPVVGRARLLRPRRGDRDPHGQHRVPGELPEQHRRDSRGAGSPRRSAFRFEQARRIWRASGYRSGVCAASRNLAQVLSMQDELAAARKLFDESLDEARLSEDQVEEIETRTRLAEFLLVEGDPAAAFELADETLRRARGLGGVGTVDAGARTRACEWRRSNSVTEQRPSSRSRRASPRRRHARPSTSSR